MDHTGNESSEPSSVGTSHGEPRQEDSDYRNSDFRKAMAILGRAEEPSPEEKRESEWLPPTSNPELILKHLPRLRLSSVINFLAFDSPDAPPDMPRLLQAAYRTRAFKALCDAAQAGKVTLFGEPHSGGEPRQLAPTEFDRSLSLAAKDNAIALDLDAASMEDFVQERGGSKRCVEERKKPVDWRWRDVTVERSSLLRWLNSLAKRRAQGTIQGTPPGLSDEEAREVIRAEMDKRGGFVSQKDGAAIVRSRDPYFDREIARKITKSLTGNTKPGPKGPHRNRAT
jgi:hypothetical protein